MKKVYCVGETLIDFIPMQKNRALKDVGGFEKAAGGAPMNAAIAVAKYGGHSVMLTKMAQDHFGDFLLDVMSANGVDVSHIVRTDEGETGLAFVSVDEDGERSFTFYRKNAADLLLEPEEVAGIEFQEGDFLHFCSVDLVESPIKQTHLTLIEEIRRANGTVCFDVNVRIPLWPDEASCRKTILEFVPHADLIKVSSEELEFVTGIADEEKAVQSLLCGSVKAVIYTKGGEGASIYMKGGPVFEDPGFKVTVEDTTGAGDAFIGGLLSELLSLEAVPDTLIQTLHTHHSRLLTFANASGALAASVKGAIEAAPGREKVMEFIDAQRPSSESGQ
ncbi:carbohydrate kinase [Bacillus sp. FJAT-42376]|uniref:carbohydrate kinase family protein n=1 Tax=Bacillus sp. FJAT-42376 TaxID=2014076 RepID=UPI000F5129F2|nr:carbohydrate kinase [Bacillus sp. FJAT-42376]AZB44747.1 carbohydrate kinase [Bacillus sp. FJAT-42376]